jgi:hypothetical protein
MDDHRKFAYRYLLYRATVDIRPITWFSARWFPLWNPLQWVASARRIRRAGAIADWVHNLALFSALDFRRFDEGRFWHEYERLRRRHPEYELDFYRTLFEWALSQVSESGSGEPDRKAQEYQA